ESRFRFLLCSKNYVGRRPQPAGLLDRLRRKVRAWWISTVPNSLFLVSFSLLYFSPAVSLSQSNSYFAALTSFHPNVVGFIRLQLRCRPQRLCLARRRRLRPLRHL